MNEADMSMMETLREFGLEGVGRRYLFRCHRTTETGATVGLNIEVLDHGPEVPDTRYIVIATREDVTGAKKSIAGNSADTLPKALAFVHWELVMPERSSTGTG
jgi:hypothetical protein